jgi:predicted Zn-dependent protease
MCQCHAHRRIRASQRPVAPLSRRRVIQALMAGASLPVIAACDPGSVGEMFVSGDEIEQLGEETWDRILEEEPRSANDDYRRRAREMSNRILAAIGENPDAWEVEVFAGDQVNAFALPGNKIGLYDGMFELAGSDEEVAAVIGHEIGHNQAEHTRERIAREIGTQAGIQLVGAALQVGNIGYANEIAGLLGAGAQFGVILPFSREQELEADALGLENMARGGYDPRAAVTLWERMSELPTPPPLLSTHPAPEGRIEALEERMPEALELYEASA